MPLPRHLLDDMARRRAAENEEAEREKLRHLLGSAAACIFWSIAGIAPILWSAHTTNLVHGQIAFYAGVAIGNGGIIFTLLHTYRVGEKRGYW